MAGPKSFFLSPDVHDYLVDHGTPPDEILAELAEETRRQVTDLWIMQVAPEQGALMQLLVGLSGARSAIEIGTFTGYSALCIARGLPEDGSLLCCDTSDAWTSIGRPYWERAGVAKKIDLRIAPAIETLRALPDSQAFDFAFVDADKVSYLDYYEELLPRMPSGGLLLIDNVLWGGSVVDPERQDESTQAIRRFNDHVRDDARVDCVMLAVSDGLTLIRKR